MPRSASVFMRAAVFHDLQEFHRERLCMSDVHQALVAAVFAAVAIFVVCAVVYILLIRAAVQFAAVILLASLAFVHGLAPYAIACMVI